MANEPNNHKSDLPALDWRREWKPLVVIAVVFAAFFYLPVDRASFRNALDESLRLARWYAREHVLLCLVPAFFIAGAIAAFVQQGAVMKYLGAQARKVTAYGVASVSGTILAVCSCTVLPLFAGIYRMGAGLGPAVAFLYSGPAINVLAIVLTARVLGMGLGIARAVGAIAFSIIIGLLMHVIFHSERPDPPHVVQATPTNTDRPRRLWQDAVYFASMVGILVFANWGRPQETTGAWHAIYTARWTITGAFGVVLAVTLIAWFRVRWSSLLVGGIAVIALALALPEHPTVAFAAAVVALSIITSRRRDAVGVWFGETWSFAKLILPLLLFGVLVAGALLGRPGHEGLIPSEWVARAVGGNSLRANFFASFVGAFMYFATLTEVPILQGLLGAGMGKGPALALLLAGPALSLPNMLVIRSVMGTKKTLVFVTLVVVMSTVTGIIYGNVWG